MQASVIHILPLTTIIRQRTLPVAGTVHVNVGQKVSPADVIAETTIAREHILIDIVQLLDVPVQKADRLIKVKRGDRLKKGTVIAEGGGLIARSIRAPRDGRVLAAGGGQVMLEVSTTNYELRAGYPGIVSKVIPDRGVLIQTSGALIQGVWGNGRMEYGLMFNLAETPDQILRPGDVDVSMRGSVILTGHVDEEKTLRNGAEIQLRGIITGSINPALLSLAMQMRYPIVVVDAIGTRGLDPVAYKLLTTNAKREVALNAEPLDRYAGTRPEVVIPLPVSQEPPIPDDVVTFAVGQQVRLLRAPKPGLVGSIANILPGLTALPNGMRVQAAEVRFEEGETLIVPLANLEVLA